LPRKESANQAAGTMVTCAQAGDRRHGGTLCRLILGPGWRRPGWDGAGRET
jgi:hypothetical protein